MKKLTANINDLTDYLKAQGWLQANETVKYAEKPGEGNMNFTLRIATGVRTFIIKQSRGYVEKYPQVAAPADRALREAEFYALISENKSLKSMMPNILAVDKENNVIMMDDLGEGTDYSYLYRSGKSIPEPGLDEIVDFAARLHKGFSADSASLVIRNREMRKLNHEHIFIYPYLDDNGLNLDDVLPGLKEAARPFKEDNPLKTVVEDLGKRYLSDGPKLLHGDYFPGSWLKTSEGIKIIDPEFCFFGDPEFEIGVLIAHLKMSDQSGQLIQKALERYTTQTTLDMALCERFTAVEILRRIMGLAQLPLQIGLEQRKALLIQARENILN